MGKMSLITLQEATEIMTARGQPMQTKWLSLKAARGQIGGAVKVGSPNRGLWLVPRKWAETYVKIKSGRPRKDGR